ncbi:MAG TPA: Ni/Fe hydrogenase subunit alpha [Planctomycetes bacterium]|nr:Ni/Fe hydrogenase subunit alpha [Planctomycetota bacterium]
MPKRVTIDPITRLEGHGKVEIFLDDEGNVQRAYLQIPELRGFEKFAQGRPAEDMPQITSRICGVCPTAHHMAATKALDDLYRVQPTAAALAIRQLVYNTFMFEDHALHFYFLGGPDFIVGPDGPKAQRNVLGVIGKVGVEIGKKVIAMRKAARELIALAGGKVIHPVLGLPGGVARALKPEDQKRAKKVAEEAVEFAESTLQAFDDIVLKNKHYVDLIVSGAYTHRTYYMGLVDQDNKLNFYEGRLRVVDPDGKEFLKFPAREYATHVAEHVEPWSYIKFCYLKDVGWKGFEDGPDSGVYAVAPLARLNVAEGMPTPKAQAEYERFFDTLGGKPVHHTLATHWARLVEMLCAAELMRDLAARPELIDPDIRNIPAETPVEGIGVVEAPRGTLLHHYRTDPQGLITAANLIVATQNNAARIAMSVDRAARSMIRGGQVDDGILNKIEMAFRAYDPCFGCATHAVPGQLPLEVRIRDLEGNLLRRLTQYVA